MPAPPSLPQGSESARILTSRQVSDLEGESRDGASCDALEFPECNLSCRSDSSAALGESFFCAAVDEGCPVDEDLKRIAARIRRWRAEADLTLQQLGDRSGVSASTIHKIENLQTVPTIAVLLKIASGLNRRPSELLTDGDGEKQIAVLRRADRQRLAMNKDTKMEHLIGMLPRNRLDVWRVRLKAGRGAGRPGMDAWKFNGEMVILVEEGCLEVEIGSESFVLESGDSIHFDPNISHRWIAGAGKPAIVTTLSMIPPRLQADLVSRITMATSGGSIESATLENDEAMVAADGENS
jgi:transcriptional regulator with XRE-family HTH domain